VNGYYLPEILFSLLVVFFIWLLPTYLVLKLILIVIYFIILAFNLIEQWYRAKTVKKVKQEKQNILDQQMSILQKEKEQLEEQERERELQRIQDEKAYKKKMQEKKAKEELAMRRQIREKEKKEVFSEIGQYLQAYVNKNYTLLNDSDLQKLNRFITKNSLDKRLISSENISEEKLQEILPGLGNNLKKTLSQVVQENRVYQEKFKQFINLLVDKGFIIKEDILEEMIEEEVANKNYQTFKTAFYNEKRALKYTNDVHDYIKAFTDMYKSNALKQMDFLVRLLIEDIDRAITKELVEPLVKQELKNG